MRVGSVAMALLLLAPSFVRSADDEETRDLKQMQGLWQALFIEANGFKSPAAAMKIQMRIEGNTVTTDPGTPESTRATLTLDASKNPRTMDLTVLEGERKGTRLLHVYELANGKLSMCFFEGPRASREHPKSVRSERGSGTSTFIFVRAETINPEAAPKKKR